jgi:hypothetical protein
LITTAEQRAATIPIPKFVYLFGFDCAANPFLLYPDPHLNGVGTIPQPGVDGVYPLSVWLTQEQVGTPLGADTLFLMATAEKDSDPSELITDKSDTGTRGPVTVLTNWLVQQLVLPSRP